LNVHAKAFVPSAAAAAASSSSSNALSSPSSPSSSSSSSSSATASSAAAAATHFAPRSRGNNRNQGNRKQPGSANNNNSGNNANNKTGNRNQAQKQKPQAARQQPPQKQQQQQQQHQDDQDELESLISKAKAGKFVPVPASLLNFRVADRRVDASGSALAPTSVSSKKRWRSKQFVAFRPEVFVQANFRLLLTPTADVTLSPEGYDYATWSGVIQAFMPQPSDEYMCPICREPPLAPRVARCGHCACLHCWCQLFSFATKQYRCPLCYEDIQVKSLKPAVLLPVRKVPTPGESVSLTLMRRSVSSTIAVPLSLAVAMAASGDHDTMVPVVDRSDELPSLCFARCAIPTRAAALAIPEREIAQLAVAEAELVGAGESDSLRFVALARELVGETQKAIAAIAWPSEASSWTQWDGKAALSQPTTRSTTFRVTTSAAPAAMSASAEAVQAAFSDDDDDDEEDDDDDEEEAEARLPPGLFVDAPALGAAAQAVPPNFVYFYQASDQQPLFLHPICMEALLAEHGGPTALPLTLRAPLVDCEMRCMDDRQRRRETSLVHLPPATNFAMLEVELRSLVSPARLALVQPTLDQRAARRGKERARLARDERLASQRAEAAAATRSARIEASLQGRAVPAPQRKPDFTDFLPLAAVAAPAPPIASSAAAPGGQEAWRRLNARNGRAPSVVAQPVEPYDEEAAYAPPKASAFSLDAFLVKKKGRK
jgi:hypothetical protein